MGRANRWSIAPVALTPGVACAQSHAGALAHTAWIAAWACLILLMRPCFAMLDSGLCRAKNAVDAAIKNFSDCAIASLALWAVGYGLTFGPSLSGWIGSVEFFADGSEPGLLNVFYQMLFAATAAAIISGAVAERIRFLGLRASTEQEQRGLDYAEHLEIGYGEFIPSRTHRDPEGVV
jgi:ammonium transporter, Amt family